MMEEKSSMVSNEVLASRQVWAKPCLTLLAVDETAMNPGSGNDGDPPV